MPQPFFQVDAFTECAFAGNPAAVCPLEAWPSDERLAAMAAEHNLSETAYFVPDGDGYRLRWFTPTVEVDLCGHATLAAAFVICTELDRGARRVRFESRSGPLTVTRDGDLYELDFPVLAPEPCAPPAALAVALGAEPAEVLAARDYLAVFESQADVNALTPDFGRLARDVDRMVIATAPGDEVDFVSRFFAPAKGVPEDPVTGSAHCTLTPYWARRLERTELRARQISRRGGELRCVLRGDRVGIAGRAVLYSRGTILV